jgi:hypothetical protein
MPDIAWQALYRAALVESDPVKLSGRIEAARLCRVRGWREICVERDSFPAPPHKNCS